jgi:hypothetical protein
MEGAYDIDINEVIDNIINANPFHDSQPQKGSKILEIFLATDEGMRVTYNAILVGVTMLLIQSSQKWAIYIEK